MEIQKYIDEAYKKGVEESQAELESLRQKLAIAEKALVQIKILRKDVNSLFHNIASEALAKIRGEG